MPRYRFSGFVLPSRQWLMPRDGREQPTIPRSTDSLTFLIAHRAARLIGMAGLLIFMAAAVGIHAARTQTTAQRLSRGPNTWTARSTSGVALTGTWTAVIDEKTASASGTWTLSAADGRTAARGTWSAAKSPNAWSGAWRARSAGSPSEYAGTWTAGVDLAADAPLARLFERSMQAVVSGQWRAGGQSGSWSIRAFD